MSSQKSIPNAAEASLKRRSILQALGVGAGAATFGVPAFSGAAAAQHEGGGGFHLYTLTPSTQVYEGEAESDDQHTKPNGDTVDISSRSKWLGAFKNWGVSNQHLVQIAGAPPDFPEITGVTRLNPVNVKNPSESVVQAATISFNPSEGVFYGIANQHFAEGLERDDTDTGKGQYVFTLDHDGNLTLVGDANEDLEYLWGSTFTTNGFPFYALQSDADPDTDDELLMKVSISGGSTTVTEVGNVTDAIGETTTGDEVVHTGLSWNRLAPQFNIVSVLGNFEGGDKDDLVEIDPTADPIEARVVNEDTFTTGQLVSTGFNPCLGGDVENPKAYSIRNGNEIFIADADGAVNTSATLDGDAVDGDPLITVDNVAEDPADCPVVCTRTIGYWKNHAAEDECEGLDSNGPEKKVTIFEVLEACGGIVVGQDPEEEKGETSAPVYDGTDDLRFDDDDVVPDHDDYALEANCEDVAVIVEVLEKAQSKDPELMLLAQLLGAKLNVCNGATLQDGMGGNILTTIEDADEYFSNLADEPQSATATRETIVDWQETLDGYNNQNVALNCDEEEEEEEEE